MKRKVSFLFLIILVLGGVISGVKFLSGGSAKKGILKVVSSPNASVFLENKHVGRTPYESSVGSGEYTIKIVPESSAGSLSSWQGKIVVLPNALTSVNRELSESEQTGAGEILWLDKISSALSELFISTTPDGAMVVLDGETKGTTPVLLSDIKLGDHSLTVTSAGFTTRTIRVKTTSGYKLSAQIQLAVIPGFQLPEEGTDSAKIESQTKETPAPTNPSPTNEDPPKPFVIIKDTPTGFLRVRVEPSTGASESARVKPGEKYTYLEEKNGWFQIKYDQTTDGWISGQYAEKVE
ncbi:MAG: PEGA domain-containing protein [bacterium]|nr:PEGA domain-containing protein [bacterium]